MDRQGKNDIFKRIIHAYFHGYIASSIIGPCFVLRVFLSKFVKALTEYFFLAWDFVFPSFDSFADKLFLTLLSLSLLIKIVAEAYLPVVRTVKLLLGQFEFWAHGPLLFHTSTQPVDPVFEGGVEVAALFLDGEDQIEGAHLWGKQEIIKYNTDQIALILI